MRNHGLRFTGLLLGVLVLLPALVFRREDLLYIFFQNSLWGLISLVWLVAPFYLTWRGLSIHSTKGNIRVARIANSAMLFVVALCMVLAWVLGDIVRASLASISIALIAFSVVAAPFLLNMYALRRRQTELERMTTASEC